MVALLSQLFSIIGGVYMIVRIVDTYIHALSCRDNGYTEVNAGGELGGIIEMKEEGK